VNSTVESILQLIGGAAVIYVVASIILGFFSLISTAMLVRFFLRRW